MFNLKSLAVAAVATLGSVSAFAVSLGNIPTGTVKIIPASSVIAAGAPFSDTFSFSTLANANITVVLSSLSTPGETFGRPGHTFTVGATGLQTFTAVLDFGTANAKTLTSVVSGNTTTLTLAHTFIAANSSHTLKISGMAIAGGQGTYSQGSIQSVAAAVPEPETYALMLAGLGALGFVARRRKNA